MIVPAHPLDNDDLAALSAANPGWRVEREADGSLAVSPTSYRNAIRAFEAARQLNAWGEGRGFAAASDGGITLPDTAVRAPDASWVSFDRWYALGDAQDDTFPGVVPDVVVEIVSRYDAYARQRQKIARYVELGARYAVLIDPERRRVEEFGSPPEDLRLDITRIIDAGAPSTDADDAADTNDA
ncbi:hypothetical protein WPS_33640 [Vulcanimicrobium alpinum]|uniref:Putative restriction endonuclease domain-containing protein n=1 Tax=Vulcanimicrobium alpinum TaxID=3016050 RepID=A0AAN1XZ73_UNVUL|nr:Uma2 family endonuclease [Vulcanimicrobium alpinum]BDE08088.1 hypothetical protein WPS_33640 [Vulcanimicrobium alpinum]